MKVLELGSYLSVSYAGMILAEQGHWVQKWWPGRDPLLELQRGDELWTWLQAGKSVVVERAWEVRSLEPGDVDLIIDNFRPSTLERWGIDPEREAERLGVTWVSMRADVGERSFDVIAQARSWMEHGVYCPFYIGDTAAGLWLAFKALAKAGQPGHYPIYQATCLEKLVEGELLFDVDRRGGPPWDEPETYGPVWELTGPGDATLAGGYVSYRGEALREPVRDRAWKLLNLRHASGRLIV